MTIRQSATASPADRLHTVLDSITDGCFALDQSGRFQYANWKAELLLQRSREELIERAAVEVLDADIREALLPPFERARAAGVSVHFEWFYEPFTAWLEVSVYPSDHGAAFYLRDISERRGAEHALRDSEARFRAMFEHAAIGMVLLDEGRRIIAANSALLALIGRPKTAVVGAALDAFEVADDGESDARLFADLVQHRRERYQTEKRLLHNDGHAFWARVTLSAIGAERGAALIVAMVEDITIARRSVEALRESERFLHSTIDALATRVAIMNEDGVIIATNVAWRHSTDDDYLHGPIFAIGCNYFELCAAVPGTGAAHARTAASGVREVMAGTRAEFYFEYRCATAESDAWYSIRVTRFGGERPTHVVIAHEDITQRKLVEEQLLHSALHDALTGLPNRALFLDRLQHLIRRYRRRSGSHFAVLFVDLDRFKVINDSLGHVAGDELLVGTARRLEQCLRPGDTIARLGGDEFVILLDDVNDIADATRVAERIHRELLDPFRVFGQEVFTSASIGIALSTTGYSEPAEVLRDADTAMYRAKANGRARHEVFDREMHAQALAQLQIENDLRRALERDELRLYYQPIVRLDGEELVGFEALVRWQHPERGVISPAEFISVAEETGLIVPIGEWVLRTACEQMAQWLVDVPASLPLTINVNFSGQQMQRPEIVARITAILAETGLSGDRLKLEITESVLLLNPDATARMLAELRAIGVRTCIDDFGTGYSSLSYLHRLAVDALKIDRSFVGNMGADGHELVRTILALAAGLNMEAIAEGVETTEQVERLRQLGSRFAQGYLFAAPLTAKDADAFLRNALS